MNSLLPESTSGASRAGRQARSTSSMAPPLFSVAHTPRFQTYLGPVKYSNMPPTVPVGARARKRYVVMLAIRCGDGRSGPPGMPDWSRTVVSVQDASIAGP